MIFALHKYFHHMKIKSDTLNIQNKRRILSTIQHDYSLDIKYFRHLSIVSSHCGSHLGIGKVSTADLLIPLWCDNKVLQKIKEVFFPQISTETIFSVLFSIHRIIESCRLDIFEKGTKENWYVQNTNVGYSINRLYFHSALKDYIATGHRSELYYQYLRTTSSGFNGGLLSIAYFDVAQIGNSHQIIVPYTQFTYAIFLEKIAGSAFCQRKIQRYYNLTLSEVRAGMQFLQKMWSCFALSVEQSQPSRSLDWLSSLVCRHQQFSSLRWQEEENADIYESCHFYQVDFSHQTLESYYIFCTFEECDFSGATLPDNGSLQGRFPILRCVFLNCQNIPTDLSFQEIKSCQIIYQ